MWYNIKFKDDLIEISNTSASNRIYVSLYISESSNTDLKQELFTGRRIDFSEEIKLPLRDGVYHVLIEQTEDIDYPVDVEVPVLQSEVILYPSYNNLLRSFIEDVGDFLCGCSDCDDCNPKEKLYSSTLLKGFSYYILMSKYYGRFYSTVFNCMQADIADANQCLIISEQINGEGQNTELFKKLVSSIYLAIYFAEYYNNEDKLYVNNKFNYNRYFDCMKMSNVNIDCVKQTIENNMGNFTVTFAGYVNQPPTEVGDYTTTATNKAELTLTLGMFTTLTTPAYSDPEGDAAQAVRIDSLPTNGATLKLDGSNVAAGQVILATDITANKLKIVGPNINTLTSSVFTFSVRDAGSMTFTS